MSPEQIIDLFDSEPDLLMKELALITGWSVAELKTLLMGG